MTFPDLIAKIASTLWGWPTIILLLGTHIFLTIRLRFPQRYLFKAIKLSFTKDTSSGDVSQFGSLMTSLAATIGTGNIVGVATAISFGGPGAVFWCWIIGVFGIATKYSEGLLATKYRVRTKNGTMLGGPMYALERGLKMKWLAVIFCIFTVIASFGIGNTIQANAVAEMLYANYEVPTYLTGIILTLTIGAVILLGVKVITKVCSVLVPIMALLYIAGCLVILGINFEFIGASINLIIKSAFSAQAASGGFIGATVIMAMRFGIARGLFSNESGLGSAPIVSAAAKTKNPVRQALVSSTATFWDTVIICALTGLVIVSSVIASGGNIEKGRLLTEMAFSSLPVIGPAILSIGIITFAISTILGWSYYGEKALEYLAGSKGIRWYKIIFILMIFVGCLAGIKTVWDFADAANALMAFPNLITLLLLSGVLVKETRKYLWNNNLDEESNEEPPTIDR